MRVVRAREPGPPSVLEIDMVDIPSPGDGEILIRVEAAGVNRPDLFQRLGLYPPPPGAPDWLGLEVSGVVEAAGPGVEAYKPGDKVCALLGGGGYAEYAVVDAGSAMPAPEGISLRDAAGLPETVMTVWANAFEGGRLQPGETILIHGGASGIGTTAIQMAAAHGARVFATAGNALKCALCEQLGAERGISYREEDFEEILKEAGGADVVLDMVSGEYTNKNLSLLKPGGRSVHIAFLGGAKSEIDMPTLVMKNLTITGSALRPRPLAEKARIAAEVRRHVWPWIEAGKFRPIVDSVYELEDAAQAHARMEDGGHAGKILLNANNPA